jgi:hypothetical protein
MLSAAAGCSGNARVVAQRQTRRRRADFVSSEAPPTTRLLQRSIMDPAGAQRMNRRPDVFANPWESCASQTSPHR